MRTALDLISLVSLSLLASIQGDSLFSVFPPEADDAQHTVFEANALQLVGTVDGDALDAALSQVQDTRWRPLRIFTKAATSEDSRPTRALFSVGVGDFHNTSAGPYRELAMAFPACEASEAVELSCRSFVACQDKLPDCAYTYMFRSWVSCDAGLHSGRQGGTDAKLAAEFTFGLDEKASAASHTGHVLAFSVLGPGGEEVLQGSIEVAPPDSGSAAAPPVSQGRNYRLNPMVGSPGVLEAGRQARHLCGFPSDLDVQPGRMAGPLYAGPLLNQLRFQPEGAFHLPTFRLVRLPPWGLSRAVALQPLPEAQAQPMGSALPAVSEMRKMLKNPNVAMMIQMNPDLVEQALADPGLQSALGADPDFRREVEQAIGRPLTARSEPVADSKPRVPWRKEGGAAVSAPAPVPPWKQAFPEGAAAPWKGSSPESKTASGKAAGDGEFAFPWQDYGEGLPDTVPSVKQIGSSGHPAPAAPAPPPPPNDFPWHLYEM